MNDTGAGPAAIAQRDWTALAGQIRLWGRELGFEEVGISDTELSAEEARLLRWLSAGRHGSMDYMARHGTARARPADLVPGTVRIITARMNYWPAASAEAGTVLADGASAYIARYALGRDYHKVLRTRLQRLVARIRGAVGEFGCRVFTDSAPVLEVALAAKAGLGWRGKHTLLLTRDVGSYFFLGEIYTDLPLPADRSSDRPLRHVHGLHRRVPHGRHRRALRARRAALHFLPDHRVERIDPRGPARAHRQPCLWLRRLPARLPMEPLCASVLGARLRRHPPWPRPREPGRIVRVDGSRIQCPDGRQRDSPDRTRTLVAEPCGWPGQRAVERGSRRGAGKTRRRPVAARARTRRVVAGGAAATRATDFVVHLTASPPTTTIGRASEME